MNWFGKKVSKVNRLESESVITPQTNGRGSHLMASLLKQIFHLHLEFFCHKMLHILPKKVRNEQREKNTFHEWKRSKQPSMSYPRAKPTGSKPTLTSGKRLLWYFWPRNARSSKKLVLNLFISERIVRQKKKKTTGFLLWIKNTVLKLECLQRYVTASSAFALSSALIRIRGQEKEN